MKRKLIVSAVVLGLSAGLITGCSKGAEDSASASASASSASSSAEVTSSSAVVTSSSAEVISSSAEKDSSVENITNDSTNTDIDTSNLENAGTNENVGLPSGASYSEDSELEMVTASQLDNVSYVMIYNPKIYDDKIEDYQYVAYPETLSTGDMSDQIYTGSSRAGSLALDEEIIPNADQKEMIQLADSDEERQTARSGGLAATYDVGDTESFYYYENYSTAKRQRVNADFTCRYVGEHCYVWVLDDSAADEECQTLGSEFDNVIFDNDTDSFGVGRFTENGGKVYLLLYSMGDRVLGFQTDLDIYATGEYSDATVAYYGLNLDKAIININSDFLKSDMKNVCSTLAHEYQHQICNSDLFYYEYTPTMDTWLNETMSLAAEEISYDGIMNECGKNWVFYASDYIRNGQSLYNFTCSYTDDEGNIVYDDYVGCYGEVYLFSEYLRDLAGDDVFYNIHDFWRNAFSPDINEAQALYSVFKTAGSEKTVSDHINYNKTIESLFESDEEEWMSKLDLGFLLKTLDLDYADLERTYSGDELEQWQNALLLASVYTNIDPVDIEGGGRIIVATTNGTYRIPEDADDGLIYIGLDENMNVVTNLVVAG